TSSPTAAMRPSLTPTLAARTGVPSPSTTDAFSITRSCTAISSFGLRLRLVGSKDTPDWQRIAVLASTTRWVWEKVNMNIGIAGTGRMGTAIAHRLIECGHVVTVWNRTAQKTKAAHEAGARLSATPTELARVSDVVITILTNADAIHAVYEAPDGLLAGT